MAIANVGTRGTQVSSASGTTVARAPSATVAAGRVLFCWVAQNGNQSTTVTDAVGNTWEFIGSGSNSAGNARSDLWLCNVETQLTTANTITVTFGGAVTHKSMALWEYSVGTGAILVQAGSTVPNESTGNGFGSAVISGLPSQQYLYFRALAKQANSTGTITSANSFVSHGLAIRSQNNASAIAQRGEYKIATSTGETSNPTWAVSGNTGNVFAAFEEFTPPTPVDLTGSSVRQDNTSTVGQVSQEHILSGNSVAQDNTSTTGAVSSQAPAVDLTGNSARGDTTSTTGAVSQTHITLGNSVRGDTTSNTGAVSQTHVLLGNSAAQPTASNTGTVTQTHLLLGASAQQNNTSTTGAVSTDNTVSLSGEGARQDNTATTGAVTQTHLLLGASARQNTTSTTGATVQTHVLAGNSVAQGNTSTTGVVVVVGTVQLAGNSVRVDHTASAGQVAQTHLLLGASARQNNTSNTGAVSSEALPVSLTGNSVAQANTATTGAVVHIHVLQGAPVAIDHIATSSAIVQTHLLGGDWVEPGWVTGGWVRFSSVVQINTGGRTPDAFTSSSRTRLGAGLVGDIPERLGSTPMAATPARLGLPATGAPRRIGGTTL